MDAIRLSEDFAVPLRYLNRHVLVTGSTGGGKTVSLQKLAEGFSSAGVPCLAVDLKGDLSGISTGFPTTFLDVFADPGRPHEMKGLPFKCSVHELGSALLARLLDLNSTQAGVLEIAYRESVNPCVPLALGGEMITLDHLRDKLATLLDFVEDVRATSGNITGASVGAIYRSLNRLEGERGAMFFGEPAFDMRDLIRTGPDGRGVISLLAAEELFSSPKLYGCVLLHILMSLFSMLPEAGDLPKPKLALLLDESHALFRDTPKALVEQIEKTVRLIRSKGVSVVFVTQSPLDIPDVVSRQISTRIMHGMRAYTRRELRDVRAAAGSLRQAPGLDAEAAITELGIGEALVSTLDEAGVPTPARRVRIDMPTAQVGPISDKERRALIEADDLVAKYGQNYGDSWGVWAAYAARRGQSLPIATDGLDDERAALTAALAAEIEAELELA